MTASQPSSSRPLLREVLLRGLHLRCPNCGLGPLLERPFRMHRACQVCGLSFFRESGYYVGAMILNYGVTSFLVIVAYLISLFLPEVLHVSSDVKILIWMAAAVVITLPMVPYSRALWLAFDYWIEPWEPADPLLRKAPPLR